MNPRLSLITLGVKNLAVSRAFYERGLGWIAADASSETAVFFQLNGLILGLYDAAMLAADARIEVGDGSPSRITLAYITASREETDDVLSRAVSAGGVLVKPAQKVFWGGYSGYFADPDGFRWEVAHNPFVTIDEMGNCWL